MLIKDADKITALSAQLKTTVSTIYLFTAKIKHKQNRWWRWYHPYGSEGKNVINLFHYVLFWSLCVRYTGWLAWASTVLRRLALCPLYAFRYLKSIYWLFQTAVWCIECLCVGVCVCVEGEYVCICVVSCDVCIHGLCVCVFFYGWDWPGPVIAVWPMTVGWSVICRHVALAYVTHAVLYPHPSVSLWKQRREWRLWNQSDPIALAVKHRRVRSSLLTGTKQKPWRWKPHTHTTVLWLENDETHSTLSTCIHSRNTREGLVVIDLDKPDSWPVHSRSLNRKCTESGSMWWLCSSGMCSSQLPSWGLV